MPAAVLPTETEVKVGLPIVRDVTEYAEFTGHTEAYHTVQVVSA